MRTRLRGYLGMACSRLDRVLNELIVSASAMRLYCVSQKKKVGSRTLRKQMKDVSVPFTILGTWRISLSLPSKHVAFH